MKQYIHKSIAFFMATVVFITTMSFTIDMHFCGEDMVDFSFFQQVDTCGMEKLQVFSGCDNPEMNMKSCCSDEQILVKGQDDLKNNFVNLTLEQQIFVASFTYSYVNLFEGAVLTDIPFVAYSPPFVKQDVQVLHQLFLI